MITVRNNLNQPIMVGERSLAAGGTIDVPSSDDDIKRLAGKGHVTIIEHVDLNPPKGDDAPKGDKEKTK